uniref:hypothetical protein n=1 Tax=Collimonas silvisoli TaxID=2825884 RepID=UPI001B8D100C
MAHWTYKQTPDPDSLEQGDLLQKTEALNAILKLYHPYYADHADNEFFIVLTQSCDLARRSGSKCTSRYISLAPVRSLKAVLKREFEENLENTSMGSQPFASARTRGTLEQFLERLFNNNDASFFYLENLPTAGVASDMCALLSLPIAIKSEHYAVCFSSRVLSIEDAFQAKLGWLIGQLYSRVGTKDWPNVDLKKKVADAIAKAAVWVVDDDAKALVRLCEDARRADPNVII